MQVIYFVLQAADQNALFSLAEAQQGTSSMPSFSGAVSTVTDLYRGDKFWASKRFPKEFDADKVGDDRMILDSGSISKILMSVARNKANVLFPSCRRCAWTLVALRVRLLCCCLSSRCARVKFMLSSLEVGTDVRRFLLQDRGRMWSLINTAVNGVVQVLAARVPGCVPDRGVTC